MSEPSARPIVFEGLSRMLDAIGIVLLAWLGWRMFFSFDARLQTEALVVALIGIIASATDRKASRNIPIAMLAYVGVALLSSAVHRWDTVSASAQPAWLSLFTPAFHLVVMAAFVYGAAYLLRTPLRLSWFVVLLMIGAFVLSAQIVFDRAIAGFVYERGGPSFASVPHWGGIHGTSLVLTIALPLASVGVVSRGSVWRALASTILAGGLIAIAYVNGSRGGLVTMGVLAAIIVLFAVLEAKGRGRRARMVATSFAGVAVVILLVVWLLRGNVASGSDLSGRTLIWQAATRLIGDYPWLGVGPGNYAQAMVDSGYTAGFPEYLVGVNNAHNLLLHVTVEVGVMATFCLLLFLAWALRGSWRAWSAGYVPMVSIGIFLALQGLIVRSLSDVLIDAFTAAERTRLFAWMILGAALALDRLPGSLAEKPS
jgi:O-antigen ligase